jgi:hypothetical protein
MKNQFPSIPDVPTTVPYAERQFLVAVKENLEAVRGRKGATLDLLPAEAGLEQVISKVNQILALLQNPQKIEPPR